MEVSKCLGNIGKERKIGIKYPLLLVIVVVVSFLLILERLIIIFCCNRQGKKS